VDQILVRGGKPMKHSHCPHSRVSDKEATNTRGQTLPFEKNLEKNQKENALFFLP